MGLFQNLLRLANTWTQTQTFPTASASTFNVSGGTGFQGDSSGLKCGSGAAFQFANAANPVNTADVAITRVAAGVVKVSNNSTGAGAVVLQPVTVASLPAAATAGNGAHAHVTDALAPSSGVAVVGGGAVSCPVYSDGTNWLPLAQQGWLTYTPTVTSVTGTITTASATGSYLRRDGIVFFQVVIDVTTNGTGATAVQFTLPFNVNGYVVHCTGRESLVTGKILAGYIPDATHIAVMNYDSTYPAANGTRLNIGGWYRT